jgi:hypothetical protein
MTLAISNGYVERVMPKKLIIYRKTGFLQWEGVKMSTGALLIEDLEILFDVTYDPRPACCVHDCSREAVWNIFWEHVCPQHPLNPTPYCNYHKELVESRMPKAVKGFKCGLCVVSGIYSFVGHVVKIERIRT